MNRVGSQRHNEKKATFLILSFLDILEDLLRASIVEIFI
jgi:hypothetical protein